MAEDRHMGGGGGGGRGRLFPSLVYDVLRCSCECLHNRIPTLTNWGGFYPLLCLMSISNKFLLRLMSYPHICVVSN